MGVGHARAKWVGAKIEASKGVAETLAAADAAILAYDVEINQGIQFESRMPTGLGAGSLESVPNEHIGEFRLRVECKGSGTAGTLPLWASTFLIASGFKDTLTDGVLDPIISLDDQKTITFAVWEDGVRKMVYGAMCNAIWEGEFGKRAMIEFTGRGIWSTPIDQAHPAGITHESTKPLRFAGATFTIDEVATKISRFRLDMQNDVQLRPDVAPESAIAHAYIADRNPAATFDPEQLLVADHDLYGEFIAGTAVPLVCQTGQTSGNIVAVTAPKLQYINPRGGERNRLNINEVQAELKSTLAGNDDVQWDFSIVPAP